MPQKRRPKRGSRGYSPRKRTRRETPRIVAWPESEEGPRLQGFAAYKAGMTHAFVVDYRPTSTTSGQEIQIPVTVLEVPPMKVAGVRVYEKAYHGITTAGEVWAQKLDKELKMRANVPKNSNPKEAWAKIKGKEIVDVRLIMYTQPRLITGVPKKVPEIMEVRVGGGSMEERLAYGKSLLGKEVKITDFTMAGQMIDVIGTTKGKGFQGHIQRWGVKLLSHKNSKHRRMIGTAGPWRPNWTMPTVPQAGQMGFHHRTEFNKRILKIGENGEEVTPNGGFLKYGKVQSSYLLLHGSTPGPTKRMVRLRDAVRLRGVSVEQPELKYISTSSKQGA